MGDRGIEICLDLDLGGIDGLDLCSNHRSLVGDVCVNGALCASIVCVCVCVYV